MNRIYRLVWNHTLRVLQVASELAHAPRRGVMQGGGKSLGRQRALAVACAAVIAAGALPVAHAQTTGTAGANGSSATSTTSATDGTAGGAVLTLSDASGAVSNSNTLTGGAGGAGGHVAGSLSGDGGNGGAGGAGVTGTGFTLTNNSLILGGLGGQGGYALQGTGGYGGNGGAGVDGTGFSLTNTVQASIQGGSAGAGGGSPTSAGSPGYSQVAGTGGKAGAGVMGAGFTLINDGAVAGGFGVFGTLGAGPDYGTQGGDGIYVGSGSTSTTISNETGGQIIGGGGGISGTGSNAQAFDGGAGINGIGFTLANRGDIEGGFSGSAGVGSSGFGGAGVTGTDFTITNAATGSVVGGMGGIGGVGVGGSGFTLTNAGSVMGGRGGGGYIVNAQAEDSGAGGAAVSGSGFTATNSGTITGGMGGHGQWINPAYANSMGNIAEGGAGGNGGAGVTGTGFTLTNSGTITGGYGRYGGSARWDGATGSASSGAGVSLTGGAGGTGGVGVGGTGFTVTNDGTITGGNGGAGGGAFYVGSSLSGTSFVLPGAGAGGAGANGSAFTLVNNGTIQGGNGAYGGQGNREQLVGAGQYQIVGVPAVGPGGSAGGAGVYVGSASSPTSITNNVGATIIGGEGNSNYGWGAKGGAGGAGISGTGFTLANSGRVMGGDGGVAGSLFEGVMGNPTPNTAGAGGTGGAGITGTNFTVTNLAGGSIAGGTGSRGGYGYFTSDNNGAGGNGGAGINGAGFTLTNAGSVTGGNGGASGALGTHADTGNTAGLAGSMGLGGAGVVATGNATLINAGSISGGLSGDGKVQADAVDLSGGGNTLELETGDSFTGNIVSTSGGTQGGDTLAFGGSRDASFDASQIMATQPNGYTGTPQYYGFTNYEKTGSSTWSITGALPTGLNWDVEQGTLDFSGVTGNVTLGQLTGSGGAVATGSNALVLNTAGISTYAGAITAASLTMQGAGTQILDAANTLSGATTVTSGTLEIGDANAGTTASLTTSQVDVQSGGVLRGHGTINGNVINDGIVRPGGSIGTLTVNGNYTQGTDGTLVIDVTPSVASTLKVNGSASLAGTLDLVFAPGTYSSKTSFSPLQATKVAGSFSTTTYSGVPAAMVPELVLNPNGTLSMGVVSIVPTDGALYGNVQRAINLQDQQTMGAVLDAALVSPSNTVGGMGGAVRSSSQPGVWMQATGDSRQQEGTPGLNSTGFGLLGGFDAPVSDSFHVGIDAGVNQINATDSAGGHARVRSAQVGLYAFGDLGPLVVSGMISGQQNDEQWQRMTAVGGAIASPDGHALSGGVQVAWPLQAGGWQLTPKVGAMYQHQSLEGFSETVVSSNQFASAYGDMGSRSTYDALLPYMQMAFARSFQAGGVIYIPQFEVGYRYNTRNANPAVSVTAQDGTLFVLPANDLSRGAGTAGMRITAEAGKTWSLYLDYQGQYASRLRDSALSLGFTRYF